MDVNEHEHEIYPTLHLDINIAFIAVLNFSLSIYVRDNLLLILLSEITKMSFLAAS